MNVRKKQKFKMTLILLTILIPTTLFSMILVNQGKQVDYSDTTTDGDVNHFALDEENNYFPETSDITYINDKYDISLWWNKTFRFRIGFVLEETEGIDRYQPVEVYFTFREDEHYEDTERLVSFNATGNDEWSNPLPLQMWNITKYPTTNFIESCTITFLVNVSANTNKTHFLYYNENNAGIEQKVYDTDFSSEKAGLTLTVTVGNEYQVVLEQGLASTQLIREGLDYHQDESLAPEKQLSDPSLSFLAHFENSVSDSTGNTPGGVINGDPQYLNGIVQYGMDFDGNDFVSYANGLEDLGDPLNDFSNEFTVCAWIDPNDLSGGATNHQTENVIVAKASDAYNDNFEMGVNNEGSIHVYIDTESRDTFADFSPAGTITTTGGWYFVTLRYQQGVAEVRIVQINNPSNPNNDIWWSMPNWNGADDIDGANGSPFTIGASEHIDQFFKGMIDEVAVYNKYLSDQEVEDFKYGSMPSSIQSVTELENGDVFSSYKIDWTTAFGMHVQDTCTFYYDYDLWNLERSIYFENEFNSTIERMFALNTNYNFTGVDDHNELLYIYDGFIKKDITTAGFFAENYTVVHNAPDTSKDAIGIFIEKYELSDPAHTSITYLRGDVIYDNGYVEFLPGSINDFDNSVGNESYQLKINFWELAGSANKSGSLDNAGMIQYFDDILLSLREDVDVYIYQQDSLFYSIDVNVTDIDGDLVPDATITVWNASNHAIYWTQDTDGFGHTIFNRFENGIYEVNVSYVRYGQTLTITTPKVIELNETNVNTFGVYYLSFTNVKLTSFELKFQREDLGVIQEDVVGANITFSIDDGSGPVILGYELTNSTGFAIFRWANLTDLNSGNVSLTVNWHGLLYQDLACSDDLDAGDKTSITLPFYQYLYTSINVSTGNTYKSFLMVNTSGTENVMLGDTLSLWLNYTEQENVDPIRPIEGGTVSYDIKIGTTQINTGSLTFTETGNGVYSLSADTSNPIETGGADWISSVTYTMEITASKPGYITNQTSITFTLLDKTTALSANDSTPQVYYHDLISLDIHYSDIYAAPDEDIDGATVQFVAIGVTGVNGYLTPYGSGGLYLLELDSAVFPTHGDYILQITAFKQNYETKSIYLPLSIEEINTRLNDSAAIYETYNVYIGVSKIFYFEYTIELSGTGLSGVSLSECSWEKEIGGLIVDSGVVSLNSMGNGLYELDLDTETLEIATYTLIIKLGETNYIERDAIIFLNIIPRDIGVDIDDIISVVSGNDLSIDITLIDTYDDSPLLNAEVALELKGVPYANFTDNGDGTYTINILDSDIVDAFFFTELVQANIIINKADYSQKSKSFTIEVKITEIFPGFPMFYFLLIIAAVILVVGSLVVSRQIRRARIPTFVKKSREMSKNIKGRKSISDSLLYPSKEEYIVKKLGDKWEALDLSLEEILGHSTKKTKNIPKTEFEGGGV
jgi:hypothetical protein